MVTLPAQQPCRACASSSASTTCDGRLPCQHCSDTSTPCVYSPAPSSASRWTTAAPDSIEHWPETVRLPQGAAGGARLAKKTNKRGAVTKLEWQPATEQRQDLRIRLHPSRPPIYLFPRTITNENEHETLEYEGDPLTFAFDVPRMDNFSTLNPSNPIHPVIALNAILAAQPPARRFEPVAGPSNPNIGNRLATTIIEDDASGQSKICVAWTRGDEHGRGTSVGWGSMNAVAGSSKDVKGKNRALDQDETFDDPFPSFVPTAAPLIQTIAPILQLQLAPLSSSTTTSALLSVRTATGFTLHQVSSPSDAPPSLLASHEYRGSALNRRTIADVALGGVSPGYGEPGSGMVVDVDGGLWGWGLGTSGVGRVGGEDGRRDKPEMWSLRKGRKRKEEGYSGMVRLHYGGARGEDAVVGFEDEVLLYDLRSPTASSTLLTPDNLSSHLPFGQTASSLLTSLCAPSPSSTIPTSHHILSTTRDVILLDSRMPGRELLRVTHGRLGREGRGLDYSLSLLPVPSTSSDITRVALQSSLQSIVELYTFSTHPTLPSRTLIDPYSLPTPTLSSTETFRRVGLSFTNTRGGVGDASGEQWLIAECGRDGALYQRWAGLASDFDDEVEEDEEGVTMVSQKSEWSAELEEIGRLFERRGREGEDGGPIGAKHMREAKDVSKGMETVKKRVVVDAKPQEESSNVDSDKGKELAEKAQKVLASAVKAEGGKDVGAVTMYELLGVAQAASKPTDKMDLDSDDPTFALPDDEAPLAPLPRTSHFVGAHRLAVETLPLASSASLLDATTDRLTSSAPWSAHLYSDVRRQLSANTRSILASDVAPTWTKMVQQATDLKERYGVAEPSMDVDGEDEPVHLPSERQKALADACDQLVLDTTLSSRVFSVRPIEPNPPSLVINGSHPQDHAPPPLHFSYFRPHSTRKATRDDDDDDDDPLSWKKPSLTSAGPRRLLSEWHMGSNPQSYAWTNIYADERNKQKDDELWSQSQKTSKKRKKREATVPASQQTQQTRAPPTPSLSSRLAPPSFPTSMFPSSSPVQPSQLHPPSIAPYSSSAPKASASLPIPTIIESLWEVPSSDGASQSQSQAGWASQPNFGSGAAGGGTGSTLRASGSGVFGGAASQVLPGAFGGRNDTTVGGAAAKEKKKAKKRVSGF